MEPPALQARDISHALGGLAVFRSVRHPGTASAALVYARAFTGPFTLGMVALMVAGAAAVLSGRDPLAWLAWAAPAVALAAAGVALYLLRSTPAELLVYADRAAVRTVWDVAAGEPAVPLPLLPPRRVREGINVGVGGDVLTLRPEEWPDFPDLQASLAAAAERAAYR